ncbi:iron-siderophore ABC transporter substrate-binding protein [Pelosinus propionicus]|uniref:Iron complex transport system substrate-binding protein n=1 Tax=Pelosinus propionicus DSM 13327 TaxID=1123291 RepID=A0A1I4IIC7_9FIRM|nr:iron-siderophore ABC transporter substrate-binding protein [Pelosinus propionicus]SFL53536.1 iron complex transport system substrate-binding protein [Pelosinus propionicus DSM 13327]
MKRIVVILLSLGIVAGGLVGCSNHLKTNIVSQSSSDSSKMPRKEAVFPRTYIDSKGNKISIEKQPQRIAMVAFPLVETMFALNAPPVAAPQVTVMTQWDSLKPYLAANSLIDLGSQTSINLEKLLDVEPELIIGTRYNEEIYDELSKIAPVVLLDTQPLSLDWRSVPREIAKVIGKEQDAEMRIAQLELLIVQSRDKLLPYQEETFAFLALADKGSFGIYGKQNYPAYFDDQSGLGLHVPNGYPEKTGRISLERLAELNPDHIFLMKVPGIEKKMEDLKGNSIWSALQAVKRGHVYFLDRSGFTVGIVATEYGVKSVVKTLAK